MGTTVRFKRRKLKDEKWDAFATESFYLGCNNFLMYNINLAAENREKFKRGCIFFRITPGEWFIDKFLEKNVPQKVSLK